MYIIYKMNNGSSNRLMYDACAYEKRLYESTSPLQYRLYHGAYENCDKCLFDKFWTPYQLVDIETELKNINRPASKCDQFKYSSTCRKSGLCLSTFDPSVPVVFAPEVCPIVHNNIPKMSHPGYKLPTPKFCYNGKPGTNCGRKI